MYHFPEEEKKILEFWEKNNIFEKSLEKTKKAKPFVFYDGPPFATGTPHYGHLLQSVIKDAIPRYKTMRGFYVERQWGWDCHGLPIENIVEKELGSKSKKDILAMGVKKFNDLCRQRIFTFIEEWEKIIPRFGRWVDMKNSYRTMDFEYMQSEWWAFKKLYDKGLIYEDYRSMHVCPRCETTLSQGEVADGYKTVKDLSVTIKFKLKNPKKIGLSGDVYMLAWTTTPWTLPGNVALAIGADIDYKVIEWKDSKYVVSHEWTLKFQPNPSYQVVKNVSSKDLVDLEYEPLFDYYANDPNLKNRKNGWKVYAADFITAEDGTGIAHEAPAFGADDWALLKKVELPFVQHVNMNGTFKSEVKDFAQVSLLPRAKDSLEEIREADLTVVKFLDSKGLVFDHKKYEHAYPHCWRCDTALLNYATSSWFVAVEKIKSKLLKTAKKINWSPTHIKEGRFGQWLLGARDWSISRQRFWANTIPVWRCENCKKEMVFGSAAELKRASGKLVTDLHKEVVDEVMFVCKKCKGQMRRIPEVLDTWFDSGSMPYATKRNIPADFIGEAQDMTRAWFYYLHVLSGALFNKPAFQNCIVTGIVLAEDGKKMSKKLKNYPDPVEVMEKYGADAMRFYILSSPVVQTENLLFSEKGVDEIARKNLGRLYNILEFYKLYEDGTQASNTSSNILDRWIISRLEGLIFISTEGYEKYRLDSATRPLIDFIDDFSVWYLRRSRERFKEETNDKKAALGTLRYVLHQLALVMAPATPFFAEQMYQSLRSNSNLKTQNSKFTMPESVHLFSWPDAGKTDLDLEEKMNEVRNIVTLALAQRSAKGIKVRQPLAKLTVKSSKFKVLGDEFLDLIKDEVNVKEVVFSDTTEEDVQLDTNITDALKEEGIMRDIIRDANEARKEQGLKPNDKATMDIEVSYDLKQMIEKNKMYLLKEVRLDSITISSIKTDKLFSYTVKIKKLS